MEIVHISAECYPVAKAGGLGDVVGALPKYQQKAGHYAKVVMPMYKTKFLYENEWEVDFKYSAWLGDRFFDYTIIKEKTNKLGFDLFLVDINGLLDREKIYGYDDDAERFTAFQIAVVDWMSRWQHKPDIVHCHDYHSGLVPFMMKNCNAYKSLASTPSILTIHNAQYQGWMGWDKSKYLPAWNSWKWGDLDWNKTINPLASGIKCAWKVTTVSKSYMDELKYNSNGLEALFEYEKGKCTGILNGIDNEVWNPATDPYIDEHYGITTVEKGKQKNKELVCKQFGFDIEKPLFVFIGRLVGEKAADVLPDALRSVMYNMKDKASYMILGSGEKHIEWQLSSMVGQYDNQFNAVIGYNEGLSHKLYAASDFLLMPSRVEPCGLNQMYSMRYGTVPIVRSTGGLKDTVTDMGDLDGFGIRFIHASVSDITYSISRGIEVYKDKTHLNWMRQYMMQIDHSWESTVEEYTKVYQSVR
ncbi:glycogen synthase [Chitinophagaceae bacterium LWZ2-11]